MRYGNIQRGCNDYFAESDNLGSTDSEVKKILTLHLPITEYEDDASDDASAPRSDSEPARLRPAHPAACTSTLLFKTTLTIIFHIGLQCCIIELGLVQAGPVWYFFLI